MPGVRKGVPRGPAWGSHGTPSHLLEDPRDPFKTQYNPLKTRLGPPDFGLRDLWLSESYHPRYMVEHVGGWGLSRQIIHQKTIDDWSPFFAACYGGHLEVVKFLAEVIEVDPREVTIVRLLYPRTLTVSIAALQCYTVVTLEVTGATSPAPARPAPASAP